MKYLNTARMRFIIVVALLILPVSVLGQSTPTDTPIATATPTPVGTPTAVPPMPVFIAPVQGDDRRLGGLLAFIFIKLLILTLWEIPQDNVFDRLYDLGITATFVFIDVTVVYTYLGSNYSTVGGAVFGVWLICFVTKDIIGYLIKIANQKHT